jgi:hypothetical protein
MRSDTARASTAAWRATANDYQTSVPNRALFVGGSSSFRLLFLERSDTAEAAVKSHELAALCSADVGRELAGMGDSLARAAHVS